MSRSIAVVSILLFLLAGNEVLTDAHLLKNPATGQPIILEQKSLLDETCAFMALDSEV